MSHTCHWTDCKREVAPRFLMCPTHWNRLPKLLRDAVWREYRPGQEIDKRPSPAYLAVMAVVKDWIAGRIPLHAYERLHVTVDTSKRDGSAMLVWGVQGGVCTLVEAIYEPAA
jgi:hypothetical protein